MKEKIVAQNRRNLLSLIREEIKKYGNECDLNHIDISLVTDLSVLFSYLKFNGDISLWDTSRVTNMKAMFYESKFNGDISNWNVLNVKNMDDMFYKSDFTGDLSNWNISKVRSMSYMFYNCQCIKPWWYIEDYDTRQQAIKSYKMKKKLYKDLNKNLDNKEISKKSFKI